MRNLLFVICLIFCAPSVTFADEMSDEAAIRHVISEYIAGWSGGDAERLAKIFDVDHGYVIWRAGEGDSQQVKSISFSEALQNRRQIRGMASHIA